MYYDYNNNYTPNYIDTIQQVFNYGTINSPIFSQTNVACYAYLKTYKNLDIAQDIGIFTNRNFTSVDRVKSLVRAFRVYYTTEEGYENAVDYLTSNFGEEQIIINGYYDNVSTTMYPYKNTTLTYSGVAGQNPSWNGANVWMASYLKFRNVGIKCGFTFTLDTNTQTIKMSWNLTTARDDFKYYVNDYMVTSNRFHWYANGDTTTRIVPIAASNTYCYGTNQQALNNGASNTPPNLQDLLNMKFTNIATTPSQYDIDYVQDLWNQTTNLNNNGWAKQTITNKFSVTKIEMIPYNN